MSGQREGISRLSEAINGYISSPRGTRTHGNAKEINRRQVRNQYPDFQNTIYSAGKAADNRLGMLQIMDSSVGLQSICINFYLNNRLPFLKTY